MRICVFCSSSEQIPGCYREAAEEFGLLLARAGHSLVYGGARVGLMGAVAKAALAGGAEVIGVIPAFMHRRGLALDGLAELVITSDLRERKAEMEARSDAFVALPGGFGTAEEILEILTLRQLGRHEKPVVFLDTAGFYDTLVAYFERLYTEGFAHGETQSLYHVAGTPAQVLAYLATYRPATAPDRWSPRRE